MSAKKVEEKNEDKNEEKNENKNEEKNEVKNEDKNEDSQNIDKEKSQDNNILNDHFENILEKDDINFDSIDFNINPFNSDNPEKKDKDNESEDLVLEEKEDDKFEVNNIQLNQKYHTSNDLLKINYFPEEKPKEKDNNKEIRNNNINNINNNINYNNNNSDNNIANINNNFINYNSNNNNFLFNENYNNSKKNFNNSNEINYDLEANSFIPRNSNNNNNNNNNFFSNKIRQSWICSFCHNLNYQSKKYILF